MILLTRFRTWRKRRRLERHIEWLRQMRVILPRKDHAPDYRDYSENFMRSLK
jgi:cytochrome b subunit of formate dehydrogenase